jgi:hypothetical protein
MIEPHAFRRTKPRYTLLATILVVVGVIASVLNFPVAASAAASATVMVQTQRMSDASLTSTQNGWYAKGAVLQLSCYKRGQSVKGFYSPYIAGGWDNLWYKVSDGYFVADVDINTGSNNPVTAECPPAGPSPVSIDTNAWFTLTARNSGMVLDLRGGSSANGTAVQQYAKNGSNAQKFRFIAADGGYYRIASALNTNQVLDVAGAGTANGTKTQVWAWGGGANQQWMAVDAGNGYINLRPRHVGRCLDVPGGSTAASVQLQIYDCNGTSSQQFLRTPVGSVNTPVGSGSCDYVQSGSNYIKSVGAGKVLGTYSLNGWMVAVCGPRPSFDGGSVGAAGLGVNPFGGTPTVNDLDGYQCTELAARWLYYVYGAKLANSAGIYTGGNGKDVVNNYANSFPDKFVKYNNARTNPPAVGDVISFNTGTVAGHVGVVYSVNINASGAGSVEILEENSGRTGGAAGKSSYQVTNWKIEQAVNWLHKK